MRRGVASRFGRCCQFCLDHSHGAVLLEIYCEQGLESGHVGDAYEFLNREEWIGAHEDMADQHDGQTDDCEREHGLHKGQFNIHTAYDYFVAKSFTLHVQRLSSRAHTLMGHEAPKAKGLSVKDKDASTPKRFRAYKSIELWYHAFWVDREKKLGRKVSVANKKSWVKSKQSFKLEPIAGHIKSTLA